MPASEIDIDEGFVRALLTDQHPDLADLDLAELANGWDNTIFRLGPELLVRLPRRQAAASLVANEQAWLPTLAERLPFPIPEPIRIGHPTDNYPWSWSIVPWFEGDTIYASSEVDAEALAKNLGGFLAALHEPADPGYPTNPYRGVPLAERSQATLGQLSSLAETHDTTAARSIWDGALAVEAWSGPPIWLHGDLHPLNLLAHEGSLSAVIDFGDITAGDPATDLGVAWMLFDAPERDLFRRSADSTIRPIDDATWIRSRASALAIALVFLTMSADNSALETIGQRTFDRVLSDI